MRTAPPPHGDRATYAFQEVRRVPASHTQLRPLCVALHAHAASPDPVSSGVVPALDALRARIARMQGDEHVSFPLPLIHYVFYPVSQLLRRSNDGLYALPDRVRELLFTVLAALAQDWWTAWAAPRGADAAETAVWEQLLLLGTMALGSASPADARHTASGPETLTAVATFLCALLRPRFRAPLAGASRDWEWDGASALPSLDDIDDAWHPPAQEYPPAELVAHAHGSRTSIGALSHVVKLSLDIAQAAPSAALARTLLVLTTVVTLTWVAGDTAILSGDSAEGPRAHGAADSAPHVSVSALVRAYAPPGTARQCACAARLSPVLPGVVSALVKVATGRAIGGGGGAAVGAPAGASGTALGTSRMRRPPAAAVAQALRLMAAVLVVCAGDAVTEEIRGSECGGSAPTRLEEFGAAWSSDDPPRDAGDSGASAPARLGESGVPHSTDDTHPSAGLQDEEPMDMDRLLDSAEATGAGDDRVPSAPPAPSTSPAPPPPSPPSPPTASVPSPRSGSVRRDAAWLRRTTRSLLLLLPSLGPLRTTDHADVQSALTDLAHALLALQRHTLAWAWREAGGSADLAQLDPVRRLVRVLLDGAAPTHSNRCVSHACAAVAAMAAAAPRGAERRTAPGGARLWLATVDAETRSTLDALPLAIRQRDDVAVRAESARLRAACTVVLRALRDTQLASVHMGLPRLLGVDGSVAQWGAVLVTALATHMLQAPAAVVVSADARLRPPLAQLEPTASDALCDAFFSLAHANAELLLARAHAGAPAAALRSTFHAQLYFLTDACAQRTAAPLADAHHRRAVSGLVLSNEMLHGTARALEAPHVEAWAATHEGRALRKVVHALAQQVVRSVGESWERDREGSGGRGEEGGKKEARGGGGNEGEGKGQDGQREGGRSELQGGEHSPDDPLTPGTRVLAPATRGDVAEITRGLPAERAEEPGTAAAGRALNVDFVRGAMVDAAGAAPAASRVAAAEQRAAALSQLTDALLLSHLGAAAVLLGAKFRPHLLATLYPVLSALRSPSDTVRRAAQLTLEKIAAATAYPSVESCVLHHADYVLGAASHRLIAGLSAELHAGLQDTQLVPSMHAARARMAAAPLLGAQSAPWVLVQVIQMLGADALPLVEDAVDEVMDALDRFHGYDDVCAGLLAVLSRILGVLCDEETRIPPLPLRAPAGADIVGAFTAWCRDGEWGESGGEEGRGKGEDAGEEGIATQGESDMDQTAGEGDDMNPPGGQGEGDLADPPRGQRPFSGRNPPPPQGPGSSSPAPPASPPLNPPPNRQQEIVAQILSRTIPFLSHGSAVVRARALDMLSDGVRVLGSQERTAELYPVLHRAWPLLLARLGHGASWRPDTRAPRGSGIAQRDALPTEQDASVWIHASATVGTIAMYAADVFGGAILRDVWPRWRRMLDVLGTGHLAGTCAARSLSDAGVYAPRHPPTPHAPRMQVCVAIVHALATVLNYCGARAESAVCWAIGACPVLLDMLDARHARPVRDAGIALYTALARSDANLVWVVLRAVAGAGAPAYLACPELQVDVRVASVWGCCGGGGPAMGGGAMMLSSTEAQGTPQGMDDAVA
ncbi:hypothetical protein MSPP1_002414 [Malassezia sp. CBS 17886]|nr:hypothetical protein MSPP1_002414 [Malassezia sp. CBS 17886]